MTFDPKKLPARVYKAFQLGPFAWHLVVAKALDERMTDIDELANIVFYLHHPERIGRPLGLHETQLINQWKAFRTLIKLHVDRFLRG